MDMSILRHLQQLEDVPVKKFRMKAANYSIDELKILYANYKKHHAEYHSKIRPDPNGPSRRESLLRQWSIQLTALGVDVREPEKIQEKLKKDMQMVRALLTDYMSMMTTTGEGRIPKHPRESHPQYADLIEILEKKNDVKDDVMTPSTSIMNSLLSTLIKPEPISVKQEINKKSTDTIATFSNGIQVIHPIQAPMATATATVSSECLNKSINSLPHNLKSSIPSSSSSEPETSIQDLKRRLLLSQLEVLELQKEILRKKSKLLDGMSSSMTTTTSLLMEDGDDDDDL